MCSAYPRPGPQTDVERCELSPCRQLAVCASRQLPACCPACSSPSMNACILLETRRHAAIHSMALGCDHRLTRLVVPGFQGSDDDTLVPFSHKLQLGMRLLLLREALCQQGVLRTSGPSGQTRRPAQVEAACHELEMLTTTQACSLEPHVTRQTRALSRPQWLQVILGGATR